MNYNKPKRTVGKCIRLQQRDERTYFYYLMVYGIYIFSITLFLHKLISLYCLELNINSIMYLKLMKKCHH